MNQAQILNKIISTASEKIKAISKEDLNHKPAPSKWSKKELLGHLIDSAYNNHQRFIRAEAQGNLVFLGYDQDDWVIKNAYQNRSIEEVLDLWERSNKHLTTLIAGIPEEVLHRETKDHNFHKICMNLLRENETSSLAYLIGDYIFHIEYHLAQIIPNYEKMQ